MESNSDTTTPATDAATPASDKPQKLSEDWLAIGCAALLLIVSAGLVWPTLHVDESGAFSAANPLKSYVGKPTGWSSTPLDALLPVDEEGNRSLSGLVPIAGTFLILAIVLAPAIGMRDGGQAVGRFIVGFLIVYLLATIAYTLAAQSLVKAYNLEYALWALLVGLIISNTVGTPSWIQPGVRTEFFIKTGLVLLGAEVLMSRLLALGLPGIFVAWVVTPIVLVSTYMFGQKVLRMESKSLNMVISADMSVCGVSAAIAAAAACKAKKEELSLAIGMSLSFTVVMMVVLPAVIKAIGLDETVGAAWMGGTIDSTGAVAAAGAALGDEAVKVAATVKMIQNILIGVSAFGIATYWVTSVEKVPGARADVSEIWRRFPRFVIGFVIASILFSCIHGLMAGGPEVVDATIKGSTKTFRGWFFCLAFISIGLETRFKDLLPYFKGGKPLVLYLCGQSLNLVLTLVMAYLMFGVLFKDFLAEVAR